MIAYDATTQTVVLFGGDDGIGGNHFNDTWTWDGTNWTQQFPAFAPAPRSLPSMAYDANLGLVVLFGGDSFFQSVAPFGGASVGQFFNDTWTWDGANWTERHPTTVPPDRHGAGMDYDPVNQSVLLFGGFSSGPARGDTWLLSPE